MKFIKTNFVPISIGTLVLCVGLYQFTFWECFAYNPMALLSFQELVTSGINLLVYSIVASLLVTAFLRTIIPRRRFRLEQGVRHLRGFFVYKYAIPPRSARPVIKRKLTKIVFKYIYIFAVILFLIILSFAIYNSDWISVVWCLSGCGILGTFSYLASNRVFKRFFKSTDSYIFSLFFFVTLPFISVSSGLNRAVNIKCNISFDYINLKEGKIKSCYKLLNVGSSTLILCSIDNSQIILLQREKVPKIVIKHYEQRINGVALSWPTRRK